MDEISEEQLAAWEHSIDSDEPMDCSDDQLRSNVHAMVAGCRRLEKARIAAYRVFVDGMGDTERDRAIRAAAGTILNVIEPEGFPHPKEGESDG